MLWAQLNLGPKAKLRAKAQIEAQPYLNLKSDSAQSCLLILPDWICGVCHIDDDDLVSLADLFSDADEFVRFHGEGVEPDVGSIDTNIGQLEFKHV